MIEFFSEKTENQKLELNIFKQKGIELFIKREDKIHSYISGNKYRKLKYNLATAKEKGCAQLLTFGGAYSNHITAVAAAGKEFGFKTIGVIRGEELKDLPKNHSLDYAALCGMELVYISRDQYKRKQSKSFLSELTNRYGDFYLLPEGGTNALAIKGCEEILQKKDENFDIICCSVGTGGTISGLINCSKLSQQVLGFPALKGSFLRDDICKFVTKRNWDLITDYHFGGYAKVNSTLIEFINEVKSLTGILLDPIYTAKMIFGICDLAKRDYFLEGTRILAIHTGGLQGIYGMNEQLKKRKLPQIDL